MAQRKVGERVRGGARMAPERGPQDEGDAGLARAGVRGGKRDAAGQPGDHRAVATGGGEPRDSALRGPDDREREVVAARAAAVADVAADQREHDVLALVERLERADAE